MEANSGCSKLNSALALTKTETIQQYHVFAYIIAEDIETTEDSNPVYGSIIILGSFSDYLDGKGKMVSGKKEAINYAKKQTEVSGHNLIFWTDTHKWFNLRKRAKVSEVEYVDDKSALENAVNYVNLEVLKRDKEKENVNAKIEEEKALHRARCNPDHIEHFADNIKNLNAVDNEIEEYEKRLKEALLNKSEYIEKLKYHYQKHPNHAEDSLNILKTRLDTSKFLPILYTWNKYMQDITMTKIYEKKGEKEENSVDVSSNLEADIVIDETPSKSLDEPEEQKQDNGGNEWKMSGKRRRRGKK